MTTLRPFGPSVTLTASARMSTPRMMRSRASRLNFTSLAAMWLPFQFSNGPNVRSDGACCPSMKSADDSQNVGFLHDDEVFAIDLDLGARPFAEQDLVAGLDVERSDLAVVGASARSDGDDFALLRLFLRGVGNDDPARGLCFGLDAADEDSVVKRPE